MKNPLREGMQAHRSAEPCAMVIFGASGDLTERKMLPALYYLARERLLPPGFSVIGCARTPYTHEQFRESMRQAVNEFLQLPSEESESLPRELCRSDLLHHRRFRGRRGVQPIEDAARQASIASAGLAATGSSTWRLRRASSPSSSDIWGRRAWPARKQPEKSWTRIIIEKPFGRDLASARELNRTVTAVFNEDQVYRIDHYLGKETVQNLLVFRFANGIFEPIWNRRYIDHVQITVAEDLGVENRGSYYEEAGLLRDMIQNHVHAIAEPGGDGAAGHV